MMELQSKHFLLRVTFKIIYNFICKIPGCWINAVSLTETILSSGLCPRECHRLGEPGFRGGTPCAEHSLIHKDKYFTCGLTNWNKVSNNGKTNKLLESLRQNKTTQNTEKQHPQMISWILKQSQTAVGSNSKQERLVSDFCKG